MNHLYMPYILIFRKKLSSKSSNTANVQNNIPVDDTSIYYEISDENNFSDESIYSQYEKVDDINPQAKMEQNSCNVKRVYYNYEIPSDQTYQNAGVNPDHPINILHLETREPKKYEYDVKRLSEVTVVVKNDLYTA